MKEKIRGKEMLAIITREVKKVTGARILVVEIGGLEPPTSAMRTQRSPS